MGAFARGNEKVASWLIGSCAALLAALLAGAVARWYADTGAADVNCVLADCTTPLAISALIPGGCAFLIASMFEVLRRSRLTSRQAPLLWIGLGAIFGAVVALLIHVWPSGEVNENSVKTVVGVFLIYVLSSVPTWALLWIFRSLWAGSGSGSG